MRFVRVLNVSTRLNRKSLREEKLTLTLEHLLGFIRRENEIKEKNRERIYFNQRDEEQEDYSEGRSGCEAKTNSVCAGCN